MSFGYTPWPGYPPNWVIPVDNQIWDGSCSVCQIAIDKTDVYVCKTDYRLWRALYYCRKCFLTFDEDK